MKNVFAILLPAAALLATTAAHAEEQPLPKAVQKTLKQVLPNAATKEIESEVAVYYVMKKEIGETTYEITVDDEGELEDFATEYEGEDDEEEEAEIAEAAIPAAVMATVLKTLPGATFVDALLEDEDGLKIYEVKVKTTDGRTVEVMVQENGELTETEEEIKQSSLPSAVGKIFFDLLPEGKVEELTLKHVVIYEVEKQSGEITYEMGLSATGEVLWLSSEGEDDDNEEQHGEHQDENEEGEHEKGEHQN